MARATTDDERRKPTRGEDEIDVTVVFEEEASEDEVTPVVWLLSRPKGGARARMGATTRTKANDDEPEHQRDDDDADDDDFEDEVTEPTRVQRLRVGVEHSVRLYIGFDAAMPRGLFVATFLDLDVGEHVDVVMDDPRVDRAESFRTRVAWRRERMADEDWPGVGLEVDAADAARLLRVGAFVCDGPALFFPD